MDRKHCKRHFLSNLCLGNQTVGQYNAFSLSLKLIQIYISGRSNHL